MISIIFITHNRKEELFRAIKSCLIQSYKEIEIIIVDNASKEKMKNDLDALMKEYDFKEYAYYYQDKNLGVAGGRNMGFEKATGEYCFFLDDDAVLIDDLALEKAIEDFKENPNVAAIACEIYQPLDDTYLFSRYISKDTVTTYVGAAHFIRTSFWKDKKLYPDNIMYGSEEMYSSLYIMKRQAKILFDRTIKVHHLPSQINRTEGKNRDLNIIFNTFICRKYFYPTIVMPILYFTLYLHLLKNDLRRTKIKEEIKKRYVQSYKDKMTLVQFIRYCNYVKLRNVF